MGAPVPELVVTAYDAATGTLIGRLGVQPYTRRVLTIAIVGPQASVLRIYKGYIPTQAGLVSSCVPADDRLYDTVAGAAPISVIAGEVLTFVWSRGATDATATAYATVTSEVS